MSDTDSFIDEVSEEVRKDQLFKLMKKYGWIAILLVVLIVGGAAYNEWRKAGIETAAQNFGDSVLEAMQLDDPLERSAALEAVVAEGDHSGLVGLLAAGEDMTGDKAEAAIAKLEFVANDAALSQAYRHVAALKLILLQGEDISPSERKERLAPLAIPGAPFRLLAEEQIVLATVAEDDVVGALKLLQAILDDGEVTAGLRRRATQLMLALGGTLEGF